MLMGGDIVPKIAVVEIISIRNIDTMFDVAIVCLSHTHDTSTHRPIRLQIYRPIPIHNPYSYTFERRTKYVYVIYMKCIEPNILKAYVRKSEV